VARQKSTHVDSAKAVGERIRRARLDAGLRQRDLAFQGCTPAYISRVEAGARIPSLQLLEEIGRRLGVSAVFLARGGAPSRERLDLADAQLAQRLGEVDEAREIFLRLTSSSDVSVRKTAILALGEIALADGEITRAIELLEEHDQLPPRSPVNPSGAEALAQAYLTRGDRPAALALLRERLATVSDDPIASFRLSIPLANALIDSGDFTEAERIIADALVSLGPTPDPIALARLLWSQSRMQIARGATDLAARYAEQALAIINGTEHAEYAARAHHLIAFIELERDNPDRALEILDEASPLIEMVGDRPAVALFRLERARALAAVNRLDEAQSLAQELVRDAEELSAVDSARALAVLAKVFATTGDTDQALGLYESAANTLADLENAPMLVSVYADWSDLLAEAGRTEEALTVARRGMGARLGRKPTEK
jgi:tetratricopeptide (TPR) repeat protein